MRGLAIALAALLLAGFGVWRSSRHRRTALHNGEALRRLEQEHSILDAVMKGTPDHLSVRDLAGRYLMINTAGAAAAGRAPAEFLGRTNAELFPGAGARALSERDLAVLQSGKSVT